MWAIRNRTPYEAAGCWGRDPDGVHEWIVAVKATFDIGPAGRLMLADEQMPVLLAPEYSGDPGMSSLRNDADLVGAKPTTDVLLQGTAWAPNGRPAREFLVGMAVGSVDKVLRVRGHRHVTRGVFGSKVSDAEPVDRVPVVYEKAYGGYVHDDPDPATHRIDLRNPVGCGLPGAAHGAAAPLPNFEYPKGAVEQTGPAGFGPLDCFWSPRLELAGTYDQGWRRERMPLLPRDWSPHSRQCAPADQRPPQPLRGGETVTLRNLTPAGVLRFDLPKIHLTFNTLIDGRTEEHRAQISSVIIEPDLPRVAVVWQSVLPCRTSIDYLEDTVIREKRLL